MEVGLTKKQVIDWLLESKCQLDGDENYIDGFRMWKYHVLDKEVWVYRYVHGKWILHSSAEFRKMYIDDSNNFLMGFKEVK